MCGVVRNKGKFPQINVHFAFCRFVGIRGRNVSAALAKSPFAALKVLTEAHTEEAAVLQGELSRTLEATANAEKFMKVVRKYTSFEELTPTLLREFVEKIVIHESEALDGKRRGKLRRQEIEIYYSFVGKVELPD